MATIDVMVDTSRLTAGFRLRASPDQVEGWKAAAEEEGLSVADWIRKRASEGPTLTDARRAHELVRQALQDGSLVKQSCEDPDCHSDQAVAHHDDYSKPLEVRWLCRKHHRQWHLKNPSGVHWDLYTFRVSDDTKQRWSACATRAGESLSEFIRVAVEERVDGEQTMRPRKPAKAPAPQESPVRQPAAAVRPVAPVAFGDLARRDVTPIPKPTKK